MKLLLTLAAVTVLCFGLQTTKYIAESTLYGVVRGEVFYILRGPLSKEQQKIRYESWIMLCLDLRDVSCEDVPPPKVRTFLPKPTRPGLSGFYQGGEAVFVRSNLTGHELREVLAHEMSHYLDMYVIPGFTVPGRALPICKSEARAWSVSDNYQIMYGDPTKVVGQTWVSWYAHCTPYWDILYPPTDYNKG